MSTPNEKNFGDATVPQFEDELTAHINDLRAKAEDSRLVQRQLTNMFTVYERAANELDVWAARFYEQLEAKDAEIERLRAEIAKRDDLGERYYGGL